MLKAILFILMIIMIIFTSYLFIITRDYHNFLLCLMGMLVFLITINIWTTNGTSFSISNKIT